MAFIKFVLATLLSLTISACGSMKAYPGPEVPLAERASLRGHSTQCGGSVRIERLDGVYSGTRLDVLPGRHSAELVVISEPFIPGDSFGAQFAQCVVISRHGASFSVRAGHRYWFYVDESKPQQPRLSLIESVSKQGPEGQAADIELQQLGIERVCYLDGRYSRCFPGYY